MPKIMLINVTHAEESRVGIVENGQLESFEIESFSREHLKGNIYKGTVRRIHPAIEAAFVDIGAERDAFLPLDEICFRNLPANRNGASGEKGRRRIKDVLKSGDEVLVQIIKEQFTNKPPTLSTFYSLPGRYLVLLPGSEDAGISRKIEGEDRARVREIIDRLRPPSGCGIIVRTAAGFDEDQGELDRDLTYLQRLWESIRKHAETKRAPALIYREHDLVLRNIRDYFTPDINEIFIDNEDVYERAQDFLHNVMPGKEHLLHLYQGEQPIFSRFGVEAQIESIYKRRVQLRSGGSIVIDGTEALTAIDVNSGGSMRGASQEETAYKTNLEAAAEVGRQLRLRDLGGIVVIDFIDMRQQSHINDVERALREAMRPDKARHDVGRISRLGLLEVSRQRLRPAAAASSYTACPMCEGHGAIRTTESAALVALRKIHNRIAEGDVAQMRVSLPRDVAMYLLNQKREDLAVFERRFAATITIVISDKLMPHQSEIETRTRDVSERPVPSVRPGEVAALEAGVPINGATSRRGGRPAEAGAAADLPISASAPGRRRQPGVQAAREDEGEARAETDGRRRRRRRGGRGRRGAEDTQAAPPQPIVADEATADRAAEPSAHAGEPIEEPAPLDAAIAAPPPWRTDEPAVAEGEARIADSEADPRRFDDDRETDATDTPPVTLDAVGTDALVADASLTDDRRSEPDRVPEPPPLPRDVTTGSAHDPWSASLPATVPGSDAVETSASNGARADVEPLPAPADVDDRGNGTSAADLAPSGGDPGVAAAPRRRRRRGGRRGGRGRRRAENGTSEASAGDEASASTSPGAADAPAGTTVSEPRRRSGGRRRRGRPRPASGQVPHAEPPAET